MPVEARTCWKALIESPDGFAHVSAYGRRENLEPLNTAA